MEDVGEPAKKVTTQNINEYVTCYAQNVLVNDVVNAFISPPYYIGASGQ